MGLSSFWLDIVLGLEGPIIMGGVWVIVKIHNHDLAIALMQQVVSPPNEPTLRDLLYGIKSDLAVSKEQQLTIVKDLLDEIVTRSNIERRRHP